VVVVGVEHGSCAEAAGIREGDILVAVQGEDVKWDTTKQVFNKIMEAENILTVTVVSLRKHVLSDENNEDKKRSLEKLDEEPIPLSSIVKLRFKQNTTRSSFSSSTISSISSISAGRKKRPWSVIHILDYL